MRQYASIGLPNMFGAGIGGALMMAKYTNQPIEIHLLIPARTDTTTFTSISIRMRSWTLSRGD